MGKTCTFLIFLTAMLKCCNNLFYNFFVISTIGSNNSSKSYTTIWVVTTSLNMHRFLFVNKLLMFHHSICWITMNKPTKPTMLEQYFYSNHNDADGTELLTLLQRTTQALVQSSKANCLSTKANSLSTCTCNNPTIVLICLSGLSIFVAHVANLCKITRVEEEPLKKNKNNYQSSKKF
jgi:hypothetical protein